MPPPPLLYKYRTWQNPLHQTILTNQAIYMARPTSFEDPLDSKIPICYELTEPQWLKLFLFHSNAKHPEWNPFQHAAYARKWSRETPARDKEHILKMQEEHFKRYDDRMGILSLTVSPVNDHLWKTYADNHTGFVVGFNTPVLLENLGGGGLVTYYDILPKIYPRPVHSFIKQHELQVYSKQMKWSEEEEYRLQKIDPKGLSDYDRTIILPSEAYQCIILGKDISPDDQQALRTSIPPSLRHIPIIPETQLRNKLKAYRATNSP